MSFKSLACVAALAAMTAASANAQGPVITAVDNGDGTATVQITPDASFLPAALAVELAVTLSGGATVTGPGDVTISEPTIFDTPNPGDSPFVPGSPIGGDANGITAPSATEIFVAYGSDVVAAAGTIDVFDIDFMGSGMLTVAPVLAESGGDIAAQGGGFNGIVNVTEFSISIGEALCIPGDTDGDGDVDLLDLDTLGANFGAGPGAVGGKSIGDFDEDGDVDLLDLDTLGANFGVGTSAAVPEPTAAVLALVAACGLVARRRG